MFRRSIVSQSPGDTEIKRGALDDMTRYKEALRRHIQAKLPLGLRNQPNTLSQRRPPPFNVFALVTGMVGLGRLRALRSLRREY